MSLERGAFLVLEGCDRAGKSTQVKMLVNALNERFIPVETMSFPDRTTPIGEKINKYLLNKEDLDPGKIHLLFSQNRWERVDDIMRILKSGTCLIVDRYAASGAAYAAANTGKDLEVCKEPDRGLPSPDLVAFLEVDERTQSSRCAWGEERFEKEDMQQKVARNFLKLQENNWKIFDANKKVEEVHEKLLEVVLEVIRGVKYLPIGRLYDD